MSERLVIQREQVGPAAVVRLAGSVGMQEAEEMQDFLKAVAAEENSLVVLDLAGMEFICSMGLGAIIVLHLRSRRHAGEIRLAGPRPAIRRVLDTTRLTQLFEVFTTVEDALK